MSNRFAEIANAKWCKICNTSIVQGEEHPDLNAHIQQKLEDIKAAEKTAQVEQSLQAKSILIPVSSNDMLSHIGRQGSPETLCGRLITDIYRPSTTSLVCDVCAELSKGVSFLVNSKNQRTSSYQKIAQRVTDTCECGNDDNGNWDVNDVPGSSSELTATCGSCGAKYSVSSTDIDEYNSGTGQHTWIHQLGPRISANYTRDGYKIADDGFTVVTNEVNEEFDPFTYTRFVTANEYDLDETVELTSTDDEIVYLGSYDFDEPVQFTAHWLEEDNEEPLFLPNDEL